MRSRSSSTPPPDTGKPSAEIAELAGTTVASGARVVATITMWKRADRKCVLVVAQPRGQTYVLQIVANTSVLRSERMRSADQALLVAEIWRTEEAESIYGATPPA